MTYELTIEHLVGRVCEDCFDDLLDFPIAVYSADLGDPTTSQQAARDPKATFRPVDPNDDAEPLAHAERDDDGRVVVRLDPKQYAGGGLELRITLDHVPGGEPSDDQGAVQFSITTLQPAWRDTRVGPRARFAHAISVQNWCAVKEFFGVWTICGVVLVCGEQEFKISGAKVIAFDRDWLQDDELGSDVTATDGTFRIDFTPAEFRPGLIFNVENPWPFGGPERPDVYFRVEDAGGNPLLEEPPSRGRDADREDAPACLCVRLCVEVGPGPDDPEPFNSDFTHIGGIDYSTGVASGAAGTGLTSDNRAFHQNLRLNGVLSKTLAGAAAEYRFEYRDHSAGGWQIVTADLMNGIKIGRIQRLEPHPTLPGVLVPKYQDVYVKTSSGATDVVLPVAPDGWIQVPQNSNALGPQGYFIANGNMISLASPKLASWGNLDMSAQVTGQPSVQPLVTNKKFGLRMRVRQVGVPATEVPAGTCETAAIENTLYSGFTQHPNWMAQTLNNRLAVYMVDIAELGASGCASITNALTIEATAVHPNLGTVTLSITGPGGPYTPTGLTVNPGQVFGTASLPPATIAGLNKCAYIVRLRVPLLLTTGDDVPDPLWDDIAFCKD